MSFLATAILCSAGESLGSGVELVWAKAASALTIVNTRAANFFMTLLTVQKKLVAAVSPLRAATQQV
jgi:hypothetical protein